MPYILKVQRRKATRENPTDVGQLNWGITKLVDDFLTMLRQESSDEKVHYEHMNNLIGAMECAKLEIYRRVIAPYEDTKIAANGDVYNPDNLTETP